MEKIIERVLERADLSEEELSECGSVNLPEAARTFLDLTPAEVVAALRNDDRERLSRSKTVWVSGWEPNEKLRRLMSAVRGTLKAKATATEAGRFYRHAGEQLRELGRVQHGELLAWPGPEGAATTVTQRIALKMRGKLKGHMASSGDVEELDRKLSGGADESD